MTNEEGIIKALECFAVAKDFDETGCIGCAFETRGICLENCSDGLAKLALALINRQQAEIERLHKAHRLNLLTQLDISEKIKAEAIKEFAERLKAHSRKMQSSDFSGEFWDRAVLVSDINNLVKEMVGEQQC